MRQQWVTKTFWDLVGGMPVENAAESPGHWPIRTRGLSPVKRSSTRVSRISTYRPICIFRRPELLPTRACCFRWGTPATAKPMRVIRSAARDWLAWGLWFLPSTHGTGRTDLLSRSRRFAIAAAPAAPTMSIHVPGKQMLLVGDSSVRLQTWDAVRSLDYLASLPMVDTTRLASTGQSGGGTNTMLLAAVDDRLAVAAVACGNTENVAVENFNPPGRRTMPSRTSPAPGRSASIDGICCIRSRQSRFWYCPARETSSAPIRRTISPAGRRSSRSSGRFMR